MNNRFVLSTKKSLFDPIEVEVDGKIYQSRKLNRPLFDEIRKHEKSANEGDIDALYKQVNIIFGIEPSVLNALDIRDIEAMLTFATKKIFHPDKKDEAKNGSKPGDKN